MIIGVNNFAQQSISGIITGENAKQLSGVMITVKGTDIRAVSTENGDYVIEVPKGYKTLLFQKAGYQVLEVEITSDNVNLVVLRKKVDLLDLSLEELLNVKITTAGKTEQNISDIPASIMVVRQNDIIHYGYKDVSDILKHIIGLYNHDKGFGDNFGVRGYWSSSSNRNIAILINGIDIRNSFNDNNNISVVNIPVEGIERVEFVRGPMAVMYGNGAFFGAINIITKDDYKLDNTNLIAVSGGLENTERIMVRTAGKNDYFAYTFDAAYLHTDGRNFKYSKMTDSIITMNRTFTKNASTNNLFAQDNIYLDFSGEFKYFYTNFILSKSKIGFASTTCPIENEKPKVSYDFYKVNFGYRREFSSKFILDTRIGVNSDGYDYLNARYALISSNNSSIINPVISLNRTNSWFGEINTFIKLMEKLTITLGYNFQDVMDIKIDTHAPEFGANHVQRYLDKPIISHSPLAKISFWIFDNLLLEAGASAKSGFIRTPIPETSGQ